MAFTQADILAKTGTTYQPAPGITVQQQTDTDTSVHAARVRLGTNQAFVTGTGGAGTVAFDTVVFDPFSLFDATNHQLVIKAAGKYVVAACVVWDFNATGTRLIAIHQNSATVTDAAQKAADVAFTTDQAVSTIIDAAVGDTIAVIGEQTSGASLNAVADTRTHLAIVRIGV